MKPFYEIMQEASTMPAPKKLFGEFIYSSEIINLFSPTSYGKSALSYHIAMALSRGDKEIIGESNEHAQPMNVLYIDGEMSLPQLFRRYSKADIPSKLVFESLDNLQSEHGWDFKLTPQFVDGLVKKSKASVVFIDNMGCYLENPQDSTEAARFVFDLKLVSRENNCAIIIISHTTKGAVQLKPIPVTISMAEGSYKISSYCDHCIGLHKAPDGSLYLRHLKARNGQVDSLLKLLSISDDAGYLQVTDGGYEMLDTMFPQLGEGKSERNSIDYEAMIQDLLLNYNDQRIWAHNDLVRALENIVEDGTFIKCKHYVKILLQKGLLFRENTKYHVVVQTEVIAPNNDRAFKLAPIEVDLF